MVLNVVSLPLASSSEHLEALAEVSHFGVTDMGFSGQGSWTYRILEDPSLTEELEQKSNAKSCGLVDLVSFQPCPSHVSLSQDRLITEEWDLPGGAWVFNGVFDGHLNHQTVDFVSQHLPLYIKESLQRALTFETKISLEQISKILSSSILRIDEAITSHILDIFPQPQRCLDDFGGIDAQRAFQPGPGGSNYDAIAQSLGGTTLILSLTDSERNLWIANLGGMCLGMPAATKSDSIEVLGYRNEGEWLGCQINSLHEARNPSEVHRIYAAHPNEDPIQDNRVLGFLEPTRAVGDTWLKLPGLYASHIYSNIKQPWISSERLKQYALRILTPPYVSNIPDIYHRILPDTQCFVILSSDGLFSADLYYGMEVEKSVDRCTKTIGKMLELPIAQRPNAALTLLRDAIGGDDIHMVSRNLTVEMEERWMDDITVLVQMISPANP